MTLVTPGHTWSQLMTWNSSSTLCSLRSLIPSLASYHYTMLVTPGHIWSQLVTNCSLVAAGHIGQTLATSYPSGEEISAQTERQTDGSHIMYRSLFIASANIISWNCINFFLLAYCRQHGHLLICPTALPETYFLSTMSSIHKFTLLGPPSPPIRPSSSLTISRAKWEERKGRRNRFYHAAAPATPRASPPSYAPFCLVTAWLAHSPTNPARTARNRLIERWLGDCLTGSRPRLFDRLWWKLGALFTSTSLIWCTHTHQYKHQSLK